MSFEVRFNEERANRKRSTFDAAGVAKYDSASEQDSSYLSLNPGDVSIQSVPVNFLNQLKEPLLANSSEDWHSQKEHISARMNAVVERLSKLSSMVSKFEACIDIDRENEHRGKM